MNHTRESKPVTYIHYLNGHTEFDTRLFRPITNGNLGVKPYGGLWASPVDSENSWKTWCECENFRECRDDCSFKFTMRNPEKVFYVDSEKSYMELARLYGRMREDPWGIGRGLDYIDFEQMQRDGWDALEISLTDYYRLYNLMYTWDCDSIVVFNKDAIVLTSNES